MDSDDCCSTAVPEGFAPFSLTQISAMRPGRVSKLEIRQTRCFGSGSEVSRKAWSLSDLMKSKKTDPAGCGKYFTGWNIRSDLDQLQ